MRSEQSLYWTNPWIMTAENAVTRRVAGLPWHLEDAQDAEVDDTSRGELRDIRTLLEKPQLKVPISERQVGIASWTNLVAITSRHLGLCGMTHWFLDSIDGDGIPASLLYINPARLLPHMSKGGQLIEWILDPADDYGSGGTALSREEVLTFYLQPPDSGALASGLVQAAHLKAQVTTIADTHTAGTFTSGGRMAGILAPKEGTIPDEQFAILEREMRNVNESPDAGKRTTVVRGPIEFHKTSSSMNELDIVEVSKMNRDDILAVWGVPPSQAGVQTPVGLNGGEAKKYDEAVLWQGAVHDRVRVIIETIQFGLLDRSPIPVEFEIEEPSFDDEAPAYELAVKAKDQPLTRNERRAIIGLDPLPEYGPDGSPLGLAIDLPSTLVVAGQGEESGAAPAGRFTHPMKPMPPQMPQEMPAKASVRDIRDKIARRFEPAIRAAAASVLDEQRRDVMARIESRGAHIARKPSDASAWWDAKRWDAKLLDALKQHIVGVTEGAVGKVMVQLGKADPFTDSVVDSVLSTVAKRVVSINETTRDSIATIIGKGFEDGLAPRQVADLLSTATTFDEARAELIARTEMALTYNEAALRSYNEYAVTEVQAIDGDGDEQCAARDGRVFPIDEAMDIQDHPNGTLDWVPIVTSLKADDVDADGVRRIVAEMMKGSLAGSTILPQITFAPQITVPESAVQVNVPQGAPAVVNVTTPQPEVTVNVPAQAAPIVNVEAPVVAGTGSHTGGASVEPGARRIPRSIRGRASRGRSMPDDEEVLFELLD